MTEADFEVMPRGTMQEVRALRRFANEMIAHNNKFQFPKEVVDTIAEMEKFYSWHVEKFPV